MKSHYNDISYEELKMVNSFLVPKKIKKKTVLIKPGDHSDFMAFITKGMFISYVLDAKGDKIILNFLVEDWWIGDIESFHMKTPGRIYFEAVENSEILFFSRENKDKVTAVFPQFELFFYFLLRKYVVNLQNRFINQITIPAKERYDLFISKYPYLSQRTTQKLIASYLGITPEFLSKIRSYR